VCIGRMMSSSSLSIIYSAVDSFRQRASLILAGIEILPNLSILAIYCIMADWGLLGLRFLSAVSGLRIEFSSTTPDFAIAQVRGIDRAHKYKLNRKISEDLFRRT